MSDLEIHGMDEWLATLRTLPPNAEREFRLVARHAGANIKDDWKARWETITHPKGHIPHLLRGIGFDETEGAGVFTVTVGIDDRNRQAFLAEIIESGTLTSAPHPAAVPALEVETPNMERYALKVAGDLLEAAQ